MRFERDAMEGREVRKSLLRKQESGGPGEWDWGLGIGDWFSLSRALIVDLGQSSGRMKDQGRAARSAPNPQSLIPNPDFGSRLHVSREREARR